MKKGDIVRPLKAFWYFWFDVVQSYLFGRLIRPCGRKVSWVAGGKLIKGELSVCGAWEGRRCWYVRFGKDGSDVDRVYIDERGITWTRAWTGKEVDALLAIQALT